MQAVIFRMDKQQGPVGTGSDIQSPGTNHNGKEYFKKNVHMCKTESLLHRRDWHNTVNQPYVNKK